MNMADDIVQVILDAREDATSLSQFMYYPANSIVERRLSPQIHSLNYYLDYLQGLELVYSQETGTVTVNGEEVKTVRQSINDSVDSVILGEYQTQLEVKVGNLSGNVDTLSDDVSDLSVDVAEQKLDTGITATPQYVGAVPRTLADVNADNVSIKSFINPTKNHNQVIRDAFSSGVSEINIPKDVTLNITESITISAGSLTRITGEGTLNFSDSGYLKIENPLTELTPKVSQDYSGITSLEFTGLTGVGAGDVIIVWNPTAYSLSAYRDVYRDGYMMKVARVSGNVVSFFGRTPKINASAIKVYVIKNKQITMSGLNITGNNNSTNMTLKHFTSVNVNSVTTNGADSNKLNLQIDKCYDVTVDNSKLSSNFNIAYPISISNCQNFRVLGSSSTSTRHAIHIGGDGLAGSVPCRNGFVSNCHLYNDPLGMASSVATSEGTTVGDGHGNGINITWSNCVFNMGASFGGRDCNIYDSDIYSVDYPDAGQCIGGIEMDKGLFRLHRCNLYVSRRSSDRYRPAIIQLSCAKRSGKLTVDVKDLSIHWLNPQTGLGLTTSFPTLLIMDKPTTTDDMHIKIDGLREFDKDFEQQYIATISDNAATNGQKYYITMKNMPSSGYLGYFNDAKTHELFNIKGIAGRRDMAIAAGEAFTTNINDIYTMRYPKTPVVNACVVGASGDENLLPKFSWSAIGRAVVQSTNTRIWLGLTTNVADRVAASSVTLPIEYQVSVKDF